MTFAYNATLVAYFAFGIHKSLRLFSLKSSGFLITDFQLKRRGQVHLNVISVTQLISQTHQRVL